MSIPSVPVSKLLDNAQCEYLAEVNLTKRTPSKWKLLTDRVQGNANIVYRIHQASGAGPDTPPTEANLEEYLHDAADVTPPPSIIDPPVGSCSQSPQPKYLLRLHKDIGYGPTTLQALELQHKNIRILFRSPDNVLLAYHPVLLPQGLTATLNKSLKYDEQIGRRPSHRRGIYLPEHEPYGLLVEDMSANSEEELLLEIKPKWLTQSIDAPPKAVRCRTCAVRAMRAQLKDPSLRWCPLDLVSQERNDVRRVVEAITSSKWTALCKHRLSLSESDLRLIRQRLVGLFLDESSIVFELKKLQIDWPEPNFTIPPGVSIGKDGEKQRLSTCMTLRDCTLFLRIPLDHKSPIVERLGDLDVKMASHEKLQQWHRIERILCDEGWYEAKEKNKDVSALEVCRLSRHLSSNGHEREVQSTAQC